MIKIMKYGQVPNSEIFARVSPSVNVEEIVADILANVRARGDSAVEEYFAPPSAASLPDSRHPVRVDEYSGSGLYLHQSFSYLFFSMTILS